MTGPAGLLTSGSTTGATLPRCPQRGRPAGSFALTTKQPLLELGYLGFQHVHLGLEFLGPCHGAPMLTAVVMGLLT
jgi:hypothetical protein